MEKEEKVIKIIKKSYLAAIKNSIGVKTYRNFYAKIENKEFDTLKNGGLSCAYFVSSILVMFRRLKKIHMTVDNTEKDLIKSGFREIDKPKIGSILVWEGKKFGSEIHKHIGFYVGGSEAISNSSEKKSPQKHHFTFGSTRKIEKIYYKKF